MSGAEPRPRAPKGRLRPVPTTDPQPPHNLEAEQAVLGAVLAAGRLLVEVAALLEEGDFYRPAHRATWRAILRLADHGEPTDPVTVLGELDQTGELAEVGGGPFLHTLVQAVPTVANAGHYARLVAEAARHRRVIDLGIRLAHSGADPAALAHLAGELAETTAGVGEGGWALPVPLGATGTLPAFPVAVLPGWLGEYVAAVATATQTPPDLAGMLALAVLATVAAGAVEVQPRPGWHEPLCLFVAVGMDAGARKSGVFTAITRPLADFERAQAAAALPGITETATLRRVAEQAAAAAEAAASKAPADQREERQAEAVARATEAAGLTVPPLPRWLADDATPEALAGLLATYGRIGLLSPEGDVFDQMAGRYNQASGPNLGVYLKGHAGDLLKVDRRGRPPEYVQRPCLTIGLAVQPEVLRGLAGRPGFRGRGLLARFLYGLPESLVGRRQPGAPPVPPTVADRYALELQALAASLTTPPGQDPTVLTLDPAAGELLLAFEQKLQTLEAARGRAADGDPAVVLVGGEAGVGKTRLAAELTARCAADGTRMLAGGCVPVGDGALPYAPVVEALRTLVAEVGVAAVRELVGPSWPELARLLPALGALDSSGPPGQAARSRPFELLLGLLGRLGEQAPLVLVVEDLHWADRSTRDLLAFLVRNLRRERILVLVTYRNDEPGQEHLGPYLAELDRGGPVQRLELPRLDRAQTAAQLLGMLGAGPPADLVDAVFGRSEGNPFFTEELLAALQAGSSALPTTLRDLLQARIVALPEPAQQVLRVVSVAGRQVSHPLLAAVAGLDERQLDSALRAAVAHQLLVTREDGYQFRHALLGEVVGAGLLPGERARLHAAYAHALVEWPELSASSPAVAAAELAIHWDAAGEPVRALPARVRAGLAAEGARAFAEAASHYQRALQLWQRVADPGRPAGLDQVDLLARAADATGFTGAIERATELAEAALGQVDPAVEPGRAAVLLARLGDQRRVAGDEAGALAAFEQAERLLEGGPPSAGRARVLTAHAHALLLTLRSKEAIARCEEAIAAARAVDAGVEEAKALRVLALGLAGLGAPDRAIALSLEVRRIAEQVGDAETVIGTYLNVAYALTMAGREHDARESSQQGYQCARELGLEHAVGSFAAANLVFSLLNTGRWVECERLAHELLAGDTWAADQLHRALGTLLTRRGSFAAAHEHLDRALRLSPRYSSEGSWRGFAELALWEGRDDEAGAAVTEGLRWWAEQDPDEDLPQYSSQWYALALRLEADRAERAVARRAAEEVAEARQRAAPVLAAVDRLASARAPQARYPRVTGHLLLAQAERSRLQLRSDPERWEATVRGWERLEYPFHAAYARFREAEALLARGGPRAEAEATLGVAHRTAVALAAGPLQREIELLAQRGRLRLQEQFNTAAALRAPASPAASLGLTPRETEVLTLVAEGQSNRQIGEALFITPKTASVHVSRILAKLGVAGRGEAAAVAHRLGLDKP